LCIITTFPASSAAASTTASMTTISSATFATVIAIVLVCFVEAEQHGYVLLLLLLLVDVQCWFRCRCLVARRRMAAKALAAGMRHGLSNHTWLSSSSSLRCRSASMCGPYSKGYSNCSLSLWPWFYPDKVVLRRGKKLAVESPELLCHNLGVQNTKGFLVWHVHEGNIVPVGLTQFGSQ